MPGLPSGGQVAPSFQVPDIPVLSIEHPCIVQNVEKAIGMLGGPAELVQSLEPGSDKPLGLKFQPDDPSTRAVLSYNKPTNNLLLKVTVPKRTGRKRKRGSDEQFLEQPTESHPRRDVKYFLRSLTDNRDRCQIEVVGPIGSTHVWRTMPDFNFSTKGSSFLNEIQSKILPQRYPLLKQWSFPRSSFEADTEGVPPSVLATQNLPGNFTYRQTSAAKAIVEATTTDRAVDDTGASVQLSASQDQQHGQGVSNEQTI
ncbi:uncharacterized protein Z520_05040 [Fonsecaea multimorphosa CBS 102226]|uniref:Transcription factor IIIC subunit Tfc1/Sfc1 triple barrel domain-containing protein n=1 Tax=Fonsecaea multimorphosa CBS 102226 TaxID=1442371 RepID=A0A0D2K8J0_9EURO|nr:uncharacterized protein Z520_05040 [Fonsecaea multimorphosa CBS 102226]KIX99464.1 hypothetical protein Z520_05040 [Fonsecaea multimorphosa CBS 102226]OAL25459.1 hypothetical protein AYO22_04778 [Fonsecaea multimorphosa]